MPADIRSFFGGSSQGDKSSTAGKAELKSTKKKARTSRRVIADSDEEGQEQKSKTSTPQRTSPRIKKRVASPQGELTTTSEYFGAKNKPKRGEPLRVNKEDKNVTPGASVTPTQSRAKPKASAKKQNTSKSNGTSAGPKNGGKSGIAVENNDDEAFLDGADGGDDVFTSEFKSAGKGLQHDDYAESGDEDSDAYDITQSSRPAHGKSQPKKRADDLEATVPGKRDMDMKDFEAQEESSNSDDAVPAVKASKRNKTAPNSNKKRKSAEIDDDQYDESPKSVKNKGRKSAKGTPAKKKAKKEDVPESAEMQAIFDSIPTVRPPTPPGQSAEPKKFNFGSHQVNKGPPPAAGLKEIPVGAENCLAGLTFVFTGLLDSLSREEGQALVKRYGGKVTTAPSKNTSYVVLGSDAGPKKLQTIKQNNIKTINEDGLFELIRKLPANGGDSKAATKNAEKKQAEAAKVKKMAAEMEREEQRVAGAGGAKGANTAASSAGASQSSVDNRLWTVKYAPTQITQICGNKGQVEKLQRWLRNFSKNQRTHFRLAGPDGSGAFRAVMIHGPPGIGKTTAAHLVAKLEGYDIVESNASDTRSKKLVETGLKGVLSTTSILGYFAGEGQKLDPSKKKLVLIMDEVDGMSAGDRGGVGALAAVCKKTQIPMILICNDRRLPKMKPFDFVTYDLPFRRPTLENIRSRIMTIAYREGMKLPPNVIDALIEGSGADIRQVVNMVSTAKLDQEAMDYNKGKDMSKSWEKHVILKPWDITSKILGGGMFAESSKATLNDKIELYFNDHEFSPLMLQENYLGTNPILASRLSGRDRHLKQLELIDKAATSISDGDLIDRMIHGPQQQWSLMPTHAVFSFVRPASFVAGSMAGHQTRFTSWLGKNSNQGKLTRMVKEIQGHMRLRTSSDRHEIRMQYVPVLWQRLVKRLYSEGKEAVPDVIDLMDNYFLTKDDFDAIMELGVGPMDQEKVKIETQTKASFTRTYNAQSHPLPFMKASNVVAPKKSAKEKPDLEEALDESDEAEVLEDVKENDEEEELDISKDRYVKQPKKKKAAPATASGGAQKRGKKRSTESDDDDEAAQDTKPSKRRGGAKGKTAAKGRGKA